MDDITRAKYLYQLTYNPNTPAGMTAARAALQDHQDPVYLLSVDGWLGQAKTWVDRNVWNRDSWVSKGNTPESYVQDTFPTHAPSRVRIDFNSETGILDWLEDTSENCPALAALFPAPALPAFVAPSPSPGGITGKPPASQQQDAQNAVEFGMVGDNNKMLKALIAYFSIKI